MKKSFLGTLVLCSLSLAAEASYRAHYKIGPGGRKTLSDANAVKGREIGAKKLLRELPYYIGHGPVDLAYRYEEWEYSDEAAPLDVKLLAARATTQSEVFPLSTEMRVIREQGPVDNRINLTIIGDGYTLAEKSKFFADVERTVKGLFEARTFRSYLPLFNVWAVFVESAESGIGDGRPKNTAFRLYRDPAGSKRGIMPGNEGAMARAIQLAPRTDYPIVLANDEYYGGLGGRWAISTSSEASGLIVLRHELGHNFGQVGEEYDNGYVYSGANSSRSAKDVPWKHWVEGSSVETHEAKILSGDYVWQNLSSGPYTARFRIPAGMSQMKLELSTVGWSTPDEVAVTLNGQPLAYDGVFHKDRSFFYLPPVPVAAGAPYELRIAERLRDGDNVLGFAVAFAMPADYDFTEDKVASFATYASGGSKSFRPTHQSCLMRDMRLEHFCVVDQENMWLRFLDRVSLIDDVTVSRSGVSSEVRLAAPTLPDLEVRWYRQNGGSWTELGDLAGLTSWKGENLSGRYRVKATLRSAEVRKASSSLEDTKDFSL
jgi:hypothetical protein